MILTRKPGFTLHLSQSFLFISFGIRAEQKRTEKHGKTETSESDIWSAEMMKNQKPEPDANYIKTIGLNLHFVPLKIKLPRGKLQEALFDNIS